MSYVIVKNGILEIGIDEENKKAIVVVDENDLSKIIGKKGINIKLASIISGYAIDVITEEDKQEYSSIHFVNLNSSEFRDRLNNNNIKIPRNNLENNVNYNDNEVYDDDLDFTNNNDFEAFEEEVKQILNQENEKNKF
ncbi:KH domain-containing protein [bacterium]|nr:KH domain-containing protein [bacterium]MBR2651983.1 KH domain-containing protein [bacterium]MBR2858001.1 KH domain-containing protein [bacterium]